MGFHQQRRRYSLGRQACPSDVNRPHCTHSFPGYRRDALSRCNLCLDKQRGIQDLSRLPLKEAHATILLARRYSHLSSMADASSQIKMS